MPYFRKKPVVIEAWQNPPEGQKDGWVEIPKWLIGKAFAIPGGKWLIETLEGDMTADPGDWIIKGVQGEFYPCKDEIFRATYDEVSDA